MRHGRQSRCGLTVTLGLLLLLGTVSCDSASSESHLPSLLRVENAQLVLGTPPLDESGPSVQGVTLLQATVWPGQNRKPLSGTLAKSSTAVSLFLVGDRGHYIVPAGAPDLTAPTEPTFFTRLAFSPQLPLGPQLLQVQATDDSGRYGPATTLQLTVEPAPPPTGALVFSLRWERAADLDLHVEEPSGQELSSRRKSGNTAPAPGRPPPGPDAGYLDIDSNGLCIIDGRQQESVIYPKLPSSGRYLVRVDTFSLCGQATAYWRVTAWLAGQRVAEASGQSLPSATRGDHGIGAGVLALELDVP
jgi:hypothetical protein